MTMGFDWKSWFLQTWEENRALTHRIGRALDEQQAVDKVLVEGMRPFKSMLLEVYGIEQAYIRGFAHGDWSWAPPADALTTGPIDDVFSYGNEIRETTRKLWPSIAFDALTETRDDPFFGGGQGTGVGWLQYALENEIHHRGQGYVYLRLLGQEPPAFYIRTLD